MPRVARSIVTRDAIAAAFAKAGGEGDRPIVSPKQLAEIFGVSPKTISVWIAKGRLDGSFRKRGKHIRFWRDKALDILFNGPEWEHKTK
jgi:transposase